MREGLDKDVYSFNKMQEREDDESYRQTMVLEKSKVFDGLNDNRYKRDLAMI